MKTIKHLKTICKHKYWVFYYCCKAGIPWRGLVHDLSKFSPTEFFESVKYYQGTSSPIDACKKDKGWSAAWMHHKGRNRHHFEYWWDNNGPVKMPYKDALELICDYLGAGRAYQGRNFSYRNELEWWGNKRKTLDENKIHPHTKNYITAMLIYLANYEDDFSCSKEIYETCYFNNCCG